MRVPKSLEGEMRAWNTDPEETLAAMEARLDAESTIPPHLMSECRRRSPGPASESSTPSATEHSVTLTCGVGAAVPLTLILAPTGG